MAAMGMKYYKILRDGRSCNGGDTEWSLPKKQKDGSWKPGKWMPPIVGNPLSCKNGYHLCRESDVLGWLNDEIYEAEYYGEIIEEDDKVTVQEARLLRKFENWNESTAILFACWCVRNTPLRGGGTVWDLLTDSRSKKVVEVAEKYAIGDATEEEIDAAYDTAWGAVDVAAPIAVEEAARAAAWTITRDTTITRAIAARVVAWSTASAVAWHAIRENTTWGVAWKTARAAQTKELLRVLNEDTK
jgi:hypothetical protein